MAGAIWLLPAGNGKGTRSAQRHRMQRGEMERGIALDIAKHDIAARIRGVCRDFDETEFQKLVERMAEIDVRYRLRDDWVTYRQDNFSRLFNEN